MSHEARLAAAAKFHDASSDGQKFLMIKSRVGDRTSTPTGMVLVLNWLEELKARPPAR